MSNIIEKMQSAADAVDADYLRLMQLVSRRPSKDYFVVEGVEDQIFYGHHTKLTNQKLDPEFHKANGKDKVLKLFEYVNGSVEPFKNRTFFFIDQDFDGMKGKAQKKNLYVTPTYSIENLCSTEDVFKEIMRSEFGVSEEEDEDKVLDNLIKLFRARRKEFFFAMESVNGIIRHYRLSPDEKLSKGVEDKIKKYISINLTDVAGILSRQQLQNLLGVPNTATDNIWRVSRSEFAKLNQEVHCRGKFLFYFFIEILKLLKDDRNRKTPIFFPKKKLVSFFPENTGFRFYACCPKTPPCLVEFLSQAKK